MTTPAVLLMIAIVALLLANQAAAAQIPDARTGDYVILLHGLGRTSAAMKLLEYLFRARGYNVINSSYPSTHYNIERLSDTWLNELLRNLPDSTARVHFVTHSMGGILIRQY